MGRREPNARLLVLEEGLYCLQIGAAHPPPSVQDCRNDVPFLARSCQELSQGRIGAPVDPGQSPGGARCDPGLVLEERREGLARPHAQGVAGGRQV
ncbi:MAG: hypothetical protein GWO02_10200, partial [Gammaproteobacteria bacterium]|nr:hypothetical protein [Gammaproteobacteria bacterium]